MCRKDEKRQYEHLVEDKGRRVRRDRESAPQGGRGGRGGRRERPQPTENATQEPAQQTPAETTA